MNLEVLYFDDCPNWKVTAECLDHIAGGLGLTVERRLVTTPDEAEAARYGGSPTIMVEGEDRFASGDEPFGLACRVPDLRRPRPGPPPPSGLKRYSRCDRDLTPAVLVGAIVCCGALALIAGLVGGIALATIARFTAFSVAELVVVAIAWRLDRRRHRHDRTGDTNDRSADLEGTLR